MATTSPTARPPSAVAGAVMTMVVVGFFMTVTSGPVNVGALALFRTLPPVELRVLLLIGVAILVAAPNVGLGSRPAAVFAAAVAIAGLAVGAYLIASPCDAGLVPIALTVASGWVAFVIVRWRAYFWVQGLTGPVPAVQLLVLVALAVYAAIPS